MKKNARRQKVSAQRRIESRNQRGTASDYIAPFSALVPGDRVIIICRVSTRTQGKNGNLVDQKRFLRRELENLGCKIIGVVAYSESGFDPYWLGQAVRQAKASNAKLVAETTDRFIRHPLYHSKRNPDAQARETDLGNLEDATDGVPLVTFLHPDASPTDVRSHQRKRGQQQKNRKGGRPRSQSQDEDFRACWAMFHRLSN